MRYSRKKYINQGNRANPVTEAKEPSALNGSDGFFHYKIPPLLLLCPCQFFFAMSAVAIVFPLLERTLLGLSAEHYDAVESIMGMAVISSALMVSLLAQIQKLGKWYWKCSARCEFGRSIFL